ncbi:MAG TPA: condensation domain-containing protein, partial [Kutzneria sp.]|nr:condensation domain-containing protein [Kutzneria sp.]
GELPAEPFDTVIINSVAQYFPSTEYLAEVIRTAGAHLRLGGVLFLGDIRNLRSLKAFRTATELRQGRHAAAAVEQAIAREGELVLDPDFFTGFAGFDDVDVLVKRGAAHNELTRHRYDVIMRKAPRRLVDEQVIEFSDLAALEHLLVTDRPARLRVVGVPDARLSGELAAVRAMYDPNPVLGLTSLEGMSGVDPEELHRLGERLGVGVAVTVAAEAGWLEAVFAKGQDGPAYRPTQATTLANNPAARRGTAGLAAELRAHVRDRLPQYMVPSAFVVLDHLPVLASGKLDRNALPRPELPAGTGRPARNPVEQLLCELFADVLDLPQVGPDDDFFELGGHSLTATRLTQRIRTAVGADLPVRAVFDAPTPAALSDQVAAALSSQVAGGVSGQAAALSDEVAAALSDQVAAVLAGQAAAAASGQLPGAAFGTGRPAFVRLADRPSRIPLSFAQQRLWFLHRLEGGSATYNVPFVLHLTGSLDVDALRAALADVLDRHETLRTVFPTADGSPYQQVLPSAPVSLAVRTVAESEVDFAVDDIVRTVFDLEAGPIVRAELLAVGQRRHVFVLVVHHIAADGWSIAQLWRDIATAYAARLHDDVPRWTELPVQYVDYTVWQRDLLASEEGGQLEYWRNALDGLPERIALPLDRPHPAVSSYRGGHFTFRWDEDLLTGLAELARACGASVFMVVHAGLTALLSRLGGGADIPIGTPIAGRADQALDDLVGFFVNTLVLRVNTEG